MLNFVVDQLHWFHAAGVIYLWNLHGKGPADTRIGQHSELYWNRSLFSVDQFAAMMETVKNKNTSEYDTASILHTTAVTDWKEYANRVSDNLVPYPSHVE
jgi:hypothetical protein